MEEVKKQGMESLFVPYEIALALKELGFDEPCLMYIDDEEDLINDNTAEWIGAIKCPLKSQAFRWFREKYGIHMFPKKFDEKTWWVEWGGWNSSICNTYEEAELECLKKLIEIVK